MVHFALSHNVMSNVTHNEENIKTSAKFYVVICQVVCVSDHQDAVTVTLYRNLWNFGGSILVDVPSVFLSLPILLYNK